MSVLNAQDLRAQGDQFFQGQFFDKAAESYRLLTEAEPGSSTAWRLYGLALVCTQQIDEGIEATKKAAALQPVDAEARYTNGYALAAGGRWAEAIAELDAALGLNPAHGSARQTLVYSLLEQGKVLSQTDYRAAETCIDRAYKINQKNPAAFVALLQLLFDTRQKPKAVKLIMEADPNVKGNADAAAMIAKVEGDSEFALALKQAQMQASPVATPAKPVHTGPQQIHCPQCKLLVAEFAAICPHCNFKIRQVGTFAGRDVGPDYNWQEVAYMIVAALWTLSAGYDVYQGSTAKDAFVGNFTMGWGLFRFALGVGLLLKSDFAMVVARVMLYLGLLFNTYTMVIAFGLGYVLPGVLYFFMLCLTGFMIYLVNWMGD